MAFIIAALRLSDTLALAARGFRPGHARSTRRTLRLRRTDWLWLAGLSLTLGSLILLRARLGWGGHPW